jgi:hypothetical protein
VTAFLLWFAIALIAVWPIVSYLAWLILWRRNNPEDPFNWRVLIGAQLYIPWVARQRHKRHRHQPKQWTEDQL